MNSIYMINETVNEYRFLSLYPKDESEISSVLVKIRNRPVKDLIKPIKIIWSPETNKRKICDFPNFWSQFTTMSDRALSCLSAYIEASGEFLELYGVEINYTAFHCLTVYDALDHEAVNEQQKHNEYFSLASPKEVLPLLSERIGDSHIFHIPEVKNKFFVSQKFKDLYDDNSLTGLDFHKVSLTTSSKES